MFYDNTENELVLKMKMVEVSRRKYSPVLDAATGVGAVYSLRSCTDGHLLRAAVSRLR